MLNRMPRWWNQAPMFWKTYLMSVVLVGGIVCTGEGMEDVLGIMLGGEDGLGDLKETGVWIVATIIPTAFGAYLLTRCFLRPLERFSFAITQLTKGDLHTRITSTEIRRGDELGMFARSFNRMAERLEHVFENERNLLAAISHELRSPLTRLSLCVELLRRRRGHSGGATAGDDEPHLHRLELEAARMNDLISQLLDYTQREMTEQSRQPVDLCALIRDVAADASFEGLKEGLSVELILPESAIRSGNALLLRQAVDNVVRNALRYSPSGETVLIALNGAPTGEHTLTVRDHGPGVPIPMLQDIFRPFFRVAADRDRASGGAGMGLCLVEQAVRLHGGQVRAENAVEGGLSVIITLPGACDA